MLVADFRILTFGEGTSLDHAVEDALSELDDRGVEYVVGPMSTTIQAPTLDDLFEAVKAAHRAVRKDGGRVFTQVSIDERLDKEETMESLSQV